MSTSSEETDKIALETRLRETSEFSIDFIIKYANTKTENPNGKDFLATAITYSKAEEVSLGQNTDILRRYTGVFFVQVYTKEGKGSGDAVRLAVVVANRFRGQVLDSGDRKLRCYTPLLQDIGPDGKGHYQYNVAIPFKRDEQH